MMLSESKKLSRRLDSCKPPPLSHRSSAMASIHEILESMRPDFQAVNALLSKATEGITELIAINKEFRANLDDLRLIVSEMGHEESETKNGDIEEELQSCFEGNVKVESDDSTGNKECSEMGLVLGKPSVNKIPQTIAKNPDGHPFTVDMVSCSFWVRRCNTEMVLNARNAGEIACLRKQETFCSIFEFLSQNLWDPGGKYLHIWAKHPEKLLICSRNCFYGNNNIHELEIASHRYCDIPIGSVFSDFVIGKEYGVVRKHEFAVNPQIQRILVYMYAELGLWDCARKVFGEMLGPYLATDITMLNATAESLVLFVVVCIHILVKFHLILNFFSTICPIIVNDKCPNQSFMQFLARQHSLPRAAFEQFDLVFFEAHSSHISLNEASKVAAPRKKIVEKINVVEVELLINNLMFVEAEDKIEIAEFQLQLLEFEEVIVAMLCEAMNVNQCFENRSEPNMHSVGRILEQQIGISSLGHSSNLSFFLVQSFKAIASKPSMLNRVTAKNNGVKMGEGPLAEDHKILRGKVTWAAKGGSCLYISCSYKFWDPGGFAFGKVSFQWDLNLQTCYSKAVYLLLQALLIFILERTDWVSWIVRVMYSITLLTNIGNTETGWTSAWVTWMNLISALLSFSCSILPRALDVATIANLNSIIHSNNAIVVSLLKDDSTFIQELFARLRSSTTSMESKKNLVLFLHEFCSLSKSLQMVQQHWLYRDLVNEGKFGIIGDVLRNQDKKLVLIGTDILILFLNQDPNLSRSYVTRQEGIPLIGLLVRGSLRETIIEIFYEKHLDQLIEVITSSCSPTSVGQSVREFTDFNGSTDMIPTKPEILLNICELLCFCVLRHPYRIKCNFLLHNVIHKVLSLTRRRGKYLVVAAVRFLRALISHNDEHLMNHIARNNLLKPIFYCVLQKLVGSDDLDEL